VRQRLFRCSAPCHNPPLEPRPNPMELALVIGTPTNNATHRSPRVFFPIRLRAATTSAPSYRPRSIGALLPAIIDAWAVYAEIQRRQDRGTWELDAVRERS
jgi:hypothetical protein